MTKNDKSLSDIDAFRLHYGNVSRSMTKINGLAYCISDRAKSYQFLITGIVTDVISVMIIVVWWMLIFIIFSSGLGLMIGTFFTVTSAIEIRDANGRIRETREIIDDPSRLRKAISTIDVILNKSTLDESIISYFTTVALEYRMPVCEVMKNATDWLVEAKRFLETHFPWVGILNQLVTDSRKCR